MEEFKALKWSWEKYEEEKQKDPKNFSFETIADRDPLHRTLNEVHLCVLPKSSEHRYLKTPEEIAANSFDKNGLIVEMKDPRKNNTKRLAPARENLKYYTYSSELKFIEQCFIFSTLKNNSKYNPKHTTMTLFKNNFEGNQENLNEKWKKEVEHFNKCAEIYYYRHIIEFNDLIACDIKSYLLNLWFFSECNLSERKYQVITKILRQKTWEQMDAISIELEEHSALFDKSLYEIEMDFFAPIQGYSIQQLKFFDQHRKKEINLDSNCDIQLSLNVITKLFVEGNEFSIGFENRESGSVFSNDVVPTKSVSPNEALEEIVAKILKVKIEWNNINKSSMKLCDETSVKEVENFSPIEIDEFMGKIYAQFKHKAGHNLISSKIILSKKDLKIVILTSNETFFTADQTPVNISIKLEFQTKFGAEKMTKSELLKEWICQKLTKDAITFRYRVDVRTMEILSITQITTGDIENELKESYNFDPNVSLEVLFNTLNALRNLPRGNYMLQGRGDAFYIYKETDQGKQIITTDDIIINSTFTRKWIPIDEKFPTFIHFNLKIAPCCFPISDRWHKRRALSYILPVKKMKQKEADTPKVEPKPKKKLSKKKLLNRQKYGIKKS